MPLSNCLMKFGTAPGSERFLPRVDRRDLIDNAKTYVSLGLTQDQAEIKAVEDRLQELRAEEKRITKAVQAAWDERNPVEAEPETGAVHEVATDAIAAHDAFVERLYDGTATVNEYRAAFSNLLANADEINAELSKKTKDALLSMLGQMQAYRAKNDKKADIVKTVIGDMKSTFALQRGVSYTMGRGSYEAALQSLVDATTAADLKEFADQVASARKERDERVAQAVEAVKDPKTVEDFKIYLRAKMEGGMTLKQARLSLSPEQRTAYDDLVATESRDQRKARADQQKTDVRVAAQTTEGQIVETKHTRTGQDLFVVKAAERVDRDIYNHWNATAKRMGGWYSSFRGNGAVPGFQFSTRQNAEAFLKFLGGDVDQAEEAVQARRDAYADDQSQSAVERLTEMADRLEERADESLNKDRKENTERRARMAANAEASANDDKSLAKTMRNIAKAIEAGTAKFLDRVRQKVQVEFLRSALRTAQQNELAEKYPSYAERERHKGAAPTAETADHAEFPQYTAFRSDLASLGRQLIAIDGSKLFGQRLMKVADDVSDAYLKFAKENIHKVSTFATQGTGDRAVFNTAANAEVAINRSGFKGKAIPFKIKNGEYTIVLSPSEAIERQIWKGDGDKRLTLSPDFGAELVEKIGKVNRRGNKVSVPWQFETAHERRKLLARMGIETPAEFRSALREFATLRAAPPAVDKVKELERKMVGRANDGLDFFPTPAGTAQEMIDAADIKEGMTVLEPSAGMGHIAEQIREAGVTPDVVEMSGNRRELLEAKGFNVVGNDFMEVTGQYDRIIMNPPFSDRRDVQHVRHAYELLKPNGRLVAIMGEGAFFGGDKKAQEFRDWLDAVGGTHEKLDEGTFLDPSLPVNTGVNARMVVIDKQTDEGIALFNKPQAANASPFDQSLFAQAQAGTTAKPILKLIAQQSNSPFNKVLARALMMAGVNSKVELGRVEEMNFSPNNGLSADDYAAAYRPRVDTAFLFGARSAERNLLHELSHAATWKAMKAGGKYATEMSALYEQVKKSDIDLRHYGMSDVLEFIAEGFSNPEFQGALKRTPIKSVIRDRKNAWQWFVDLVRRILNLKDGNALSEFLEVGTRLLGENQAIVEENARPSNNSGISTGMPSELGTQERTVRADTSGSSELAQIRSEAARRKNPITISPEAEAAALRAANIEIAKDNQTQIDEQLRAIENGARKGADISELAENPDYWNAENEQLTDAGYAEYDRMNQDIAAERANVKLATSLEDLDNAHQFAQVDAMEKILDSLGLNYQRGRTFSTSRYLEIDRGENEMPLKLRFANHANTVRDSGMTPDVNVAPGASTFTDALDRVLELANRNGADLGNVKQDWVNPVRDNINDLMRSNSVFNWWNRTIGTQFAKAKKDADFGRVFNGAQSLLDDVSRYATEASDLAPDILPKMENVTDAFRGIKDDLPGGKRQKDLEATAGAIFKGTLENKVWTDEELRITHKLNDEQIGLYRQFRKSVNRSLDQVAVAEMIRLTRGMGIDTSGMRDMTAQDASAAIQKALEGNVDRAALEVKKAVQDRAGKVAGLKANGYAPLMRFGKYTLNVSNDQGESVFFQMFDRERDANQFLRKNKDALPEGRVTQGVLSEESYKLFQKFSPDALEIFGDTATLDVTDSNGVLHAVKMSDTPAFQQYLKLAVANRSAMKRLIERKGTAGFSNDAPRVLAAFLLSNARAASSSLHMADLLQAANDIPKEKGDVKDEAVRLVEYLRNPGEEAAKIRGLLFANYLGGSVASALVNLTQPVMMTYPHLTQWGFAKAASAMANGVKVAMTGKVPPEMQADYKRAQKEGVVEPQEVHALFAESDRSLGNSMPMRRLLRVWGSFFSAAESLNRRITFSAAYEIGQGLTADELTKAGAANAYEFAKNVTQETQGIYAKSNRPNWARGAVGALVFTFKQYSINYVEWISRLPRQQQLAALGMLMLVSGVQGLPFADDLDDLIDTLAQALGFAWNTKDEKRKFLQEYLGEAGTDFVMSGASAIPGVPLDVQGRLGMGNLIPTTGALKRSSANPERDTLELLGPAGSLAKSALQSSKDALAGNFWEATKGMFPIAAQNAEKMIDMAQTGMYRDTRGRKVTETDAIDAIIKGIGFQPQAVAKQQRISGINQDRINLAKNVETDIADQIAQGIFEKDQEKAQDGWKQLRDWNLRNPQSRIFISPAQIRSRIQAMNTSKDQRIIKSAPKEMRASVAGAYQ